MFHVSASKFFVLFLCANVIFDGTEAAEAEEEPSVANGITSKNHVPTYLLSTYQPTKYLPTKYLPTKYLPTKYLPTITYLPSTYLLRTLWVDINRSPLDSLKVKIR